MGIGRMDIERFKIYLCVVCDKGEIIERITEHTISEYEVPDISNCDFSNYDNYRVIGGKLLLNRPNIEWKSEHRKRDQKRPLGGVCDMCLSHPIVVGLRIGGHILFDPEGS